MPSNICYECDNIEEIVLYDTVTEISLYAFYGCDNLKSLPLGTNLKDISGYAFSYSGIKTVHLPENIHLWQQALEHCYNLEKIIFNGKIDAEWGAFWQAGTIDTIEIPNLETWFYLLTLDLAGYSDITANFLVINGELLENLIIPDTFSVIPNNAFKNNLGIKNIVIPDSISSIGESAFYNCDNLVQVVLAESVGTIANSAFSSCNNLSLVFYSASEDDWNLIDIGSSNSSLINATIYYNYKNHGSSEPWFFLAIHIIVPFFLTGRKNDIFFDEFIYLTIIFYTIIMFKSLLYPFHLAFVARTSI